MREITQHWCGAVAFLLFLQISASALRYYVRIFIVRRVWWDDLFTFITLILSIGYACGILVLFIQTDDLPISQMNINYLIPDLQLFTALVIVFGLCTCFLKISIGVFLFKIFGVQRRERIIIYCVLAVNIVYTIFYFFYTLLSCGNPTKAVFAELSGQCLTADSVAGIGYSQSILTAGSDIVLAFLPISYLRKANMSRKLKYTCGSILALAFVGCIVTLVRLGFVHVLLTNDDNVLITNNTIGFTTGLELCIGITCLAATTYKPLFKKDFFGANSENPDSRENGGAPMAYVAPASDPMDRYRKKPRDPYDIESGFHGNVTNATTSSGGDDSVDSNETAVMSLEELSNGKYFQRVAKKPVVLKPLKQHTTDSDVTL